MEFRKQPKTRWWRAKASLGEHTVEVSVAERVPAAERTVVAGAALAKIDGEWPAVQNALARCLLAHYNDVWAIPDEGLPRLKKKQFLAKLIPAYVLIDERRAVSLCFNDSDLFGGHDVTVEWDAGGKMSDPELA